MGTFFFIFAIFFFFFQKWTIFSYKKKKIMGKKTKMRPPYWLQKRTPAGPETEVFFRLASEYLDTPVEENMRILAACTSVEESVKNTCRRHCEHTCTRPYKVRLYEMHTHIHVYRKKCQNK